MKKAILLVASGTTRRECGEVFRRLEARVRRRFRGMTVRWAFSSAMIRSRLAAEGIVIPSPADALKALRHDGYSRVAVGSLHMIAGMEYDELREGVAAFAHGRRPFDRIVLGKPLLGSYADLVRVIKVLLDELPAGRKKSDAVIFMGHGNEDHPGQLAYHAAARVANQLDRFAFVAVLEGQPELKDAISACRDAGARRVYLVPLMSVAGTHVVRDMAGEGKEAWKSVARRAGLESVPVIRGVLEHGRIASVWLSHLERAVANL